MVDHIFVCYSRKDGDFVLKLAMDLKLSGVPIWLDQWDIPSGANWDRAIEAALKKCDRLLLVLSPASLNSDRVQNEWIWAIDKGKKVVVPILYQECEIPIRLTSIEYTDFTSRSPNDADATKKLRKALGMPLIDDSSRTLKKIFFSHSFLEKDRDLVNDIANFIETYGISLITGDSLGGSQLWEIILKYIEDCDGFVGLVTRNENLEDEWKISRFVQDEIKYAHSKGKPIFLIIENGINIEDYQDFSPNSKIILDRNNLYKAYLSLAQTIGRLKKDSGQTIRVNISPDSLVRKLRRDHGKYKCFYRCIIESGSATDWKEGKIIFLPGFATAFLSGVQEDSLIQLSIEGQSEKWLSSPIAQSMQIEMFKSEEQKENE
jgi:hypothetical protein